MRRRRSVIAAGLVCLFAAGAGAGAVRRGVHHRLYDALLPVVIAHRVTASAPSAAAAAERLQEFVYLNVRTPDEAPTLDYETPNVLLRGFGYCDQAVSVFVHLLQEEDISGRLTWLKRDDGTSPHTVSEVLLDGDWRVFDTAYGWMPRRPDGARARARDLARRPEWLGVSRAESEWYRNVEVRLVLGPERLRFEGITAGFVTRALVRRLVEWTPAWVVDRLQDGYLLLPARPVPDPRFHDEPVTRRAFLRARHYHVLLRAAEAEAAYRQLLDGRGTRRGEEHVLYNHGLLLLTQRRDPAGALVSLDRLLARFPRTSWRREATYLAARAHEQLGACRAAVRLYRKVVEGRANGLEDARLRLARLPCA